MLIIFLIFAIAPYCIFPYFSGFGSLGNTRKSTPATNGEPPKHPDGGGSAFSLSEPVQLF